MKWVPFVLGVFLVHSVLAAPGDSVNSVVQDGSLDVKSGFGKDHGVLDPDQAPETQKLVKDLFYECLGEPCSPVISLRKIDALLVRLRDEDRRLVADLNESAILEEIETDVRLPQNAIRRAGEQLHGQTKINRVYPEYLIPTITTLRNLVQSNRHPDQWEGLIHDFIRGYHIFYFPNNHVKMWARSNDIKHIIKHSFVSYKFKRDNDEQKEAINLILEPENVDDVNRTLDSRFEVGHYLSQSELHLLKEKGFDISRLNPGVSAFWENRTPEEITSFKEGYGVVYPAPDTRLVYNGIILTGSVSPKLEVESVIDGIRRKYKVKWGRETHADIAATALAFFVGLNGDPMQYRPEIKIHLGKYSYEDFISQYQAKYAGLQTYNYIASHGGPKGDEWIVIKDALFEGRPLEHEVRILPFDSTAMDFNFRREFGARLLFYALIGQQDTKVSNLKFVLSTRNRPLHPSPLSQLLGFEDPRPRVQLRLQDTGYSFGPRRYYSDNPIKYIYENKYLPNEFEADGNVVTSDDGIEVRWVDFYHLEKEFQNATYWDMKWMARKIARLSGDDIEFCLTRGGMPPEIAKLYRLKLVSRKNEMIRAFGLNRDPIQPIPEEDSPSYKTYTSPPNEQTQKPAVKNGTLVQGHFEGKKIYVVNQATVSYYLVGLINSFFSTIMTGVSGSPVAGYDHKANVNNIQFNPLVGLTGLTRITAGTTATNLASKQVSTSYFSKPIQVSLGLGVSATLSRSVSAAREPFNSDHDHRARPFIVNDSLSIQIGFNSPLFDKLMKALPVQALGAFRLFQANYEWNHYAESLAAGYEAPIAPFFEYLLSPVGRTAELLDREEALTKSFAVGGELAASAGMDFGSTPVFKALNNSTGFSVGLVKLQERAYVRDQYGQFHIFDQKTIESYGGINLLLGDIFNPLMSQFPLASFGRSIFKYRTKQVDVFVPRQDGVYSHDTPILDGDGRLAKDITEWVGGYPEKAEAFETNFKITSEGVLKNSLNFFLFNGKAESERATRSQLELRDGNRKDLFSYTKTTDKYLGISSQYLTFIKQQDVTVKEAQRTYINLEMDHHHPEGLTVILRATNFFRKGNKKNVEEVIASINRRFSQSPELPLYRDYVLPPETDVDLYRKCYAMTRIYIEGYRLLGKIESLSVEKLREMAKQYFSAVLPTRFSSALTSAYYDYKLWERVNRIEKSFLRLQKETKKLNRDYTAIFPLLEDFLYQQKITKNGIGLIQSILNDQGGVNAGENAILVMGDIQGIYESFSTMNDLQQRQRRHFVGKHWGKFNLVGPVQYHNRYNNVLYQGPTVLPQINAETMFGDTTWLGTPEELGT